MYYFRLELKPFLLGETDVAPKCIDPEKTISPIPYALVKEVEKVDIETEIHGEMIWYTLTHNISPERTVTYSGSVCDEDYYSKFLKFWKRKCKVHLDFDLKGGFRSPSS
ncbi:unnamed protein product [Gongylonema pulchrum]|uniref:DUF3694 domain-containing protein n=1 Tax=Gongylonema pulchrum TaxID=637853 RepID=A0A183DWD2_9BILA|nr:unnamed protein product [Gongylonema pulchrum]